MNKRGYTLTEILLVLGLLSMLGSVATVTYRGHNLDIEKQNLKNAGELFAGAVRTCISASGGWDIDRPDGTNVKPCNTIAKLDYTCPAGATCNPLIHPNAYDPDSDHRKYYCLNIKKEVSGKHLQVMVRFTWLKPNDYEIWCGESSSFILSQQNCRGQRDGQVYRHTSLTDLKYPCDWK